MSDTPCGDHRVTALALVAAVALLAGCASPPAPPENHDPAQEPPTRPEAPDSPPGPDADGLPAVLTEADDGRHIALAAGEEVALRLDNDWLWDAPVVDGDAVLLAVVDYLVDPGFTEWVVQAARPGAAELTVGGEPNCGDPSACPPTTVRLRVSVGD